MARNPAGRCEVEGCPKPAARRGRCWTHVSRPPPSRLCEVDDCDKLAINGPLCEGHRKQKQRKGRVTGPLRPPLGRPAYDSPVEWLLAAARRYEDAPAEDDKAYDRALRELLRANAAVQRMVDEGLLPVPARRETPPRAEEDSPGRKAG